MSISIDISRAVGVNWQDVKNELRNTAGHSNWSCKPHRSKTSKRVCERDANFGGPFLNQGVCQENCVRDSKILTTPGSPYMSGAFDPNQPLPNGKPVANADETKYINDNYIQSDDDGRYYSKADYNAYKKIANDRNTAAHSQIVAELEADAETPDFTVIEPNTNNGGGVSVDDWYML